MWDSKTLGLVIGDNVDSGKCGLSDVWTRGRVGSKTFGMCGPGDVWTQGHVDSGTCELGDVSTRG